MLGFYNYTVILTYIGMLSSFIGITFAVTGNIKYALICLMFSGLCDMFDGKIASTMERTREQKDFGIQIDSLSDIICFGMLPAIIVFETDPGNWLIRAICGLFVLCGLIRLAFFNVDETARQGKTDAHRETYLGLPITSSAVIVPLFFWIDSIHGMQINLIMPLVLALNALAFITPFKIKKPAKIGKLFLILAGLAEFIAVILCKSL